MVSTRKVRFAPLSGDGSSSSGDSSSSSSSSSCSSIPDWYLSLEENEQTRQRWWTPQELEEIRKHSKSLVMENTTKDCKSSTGSFYRTMKKIQCASMMHEEDTVPHLSPALQRDVMHYWTSAGFLRGLERNTLESNTKKPERFVVQEAVLFLQETMFQDDSVDYECSCEVIRMASESVSASSRTYARILGQADEIAARLEHGFFLYNNKSNQRLPSQPKMDRSPSNASRRHRRPSMGVNTPTMIRSC